MHIIELNQSHVGKKIRCIMGSTIIEDAKVGFENNQYYICQNTKNGNYCQERFGYSFSWAMDGSVVDIELLEQEIVNNYSIY